jgi:DNA-binding NarL/FixJ family response regulator
MIRVLLVDDQSLVRAGFRMILQDEPDIEVVGEAADGQAAIAAVEGERPDVIVMDIRMPVLDGVEATRRIVQAGALASPGERVADEGGELRPRVLVLTTFDADEIVVEALRAGASGFLLKDVQPLDFIAAIRIVASGEALLAPAVTRRLLDRFADRLPPVDDARHEALARLTERELDVLRLIARGLANREIAERLAVSEPTVKTHVSHVLDKLGLRDRAQAVVLAYEVGMVRPGGIDPEGPAGG